MHPAPHGPSQARRTARIRISAIVAAFVLVGALSGCQPGPPTDPAHSRIDLRFLVVDDGSPMVAAITDQLTTEGIPYTSISLADATRPAITPGMLSTGSHARFQAVVLPNERGGNLAPSELDALHAYETAFDIRQIDAYTYASANVGLDSSQPMFNGDLDGTTATVTSSGKDQGFGYLNGPVPFAAGSYASVAPPLPTSSLPDVSDFTTLVSAPIPASGSSGSIIGSYRSHGREELVITAAFAPTFSQFRALGHGIVTWATRGVHLGYNRNYFSMQVDDIFNSDARWDAEHHCTPGEDCPRDADGNSVYPETDVRMTPQDVDALVAWQQSHDFSLQMVFNGGLTSATDPLTQAFLAQKNQFWWINHTWTHEFLGCVQDFSVVPWRCVTDPGTGAITWEPESLTLSQVGFNIAWAIAHGLPFDPTELVTGDYSGLQIPGFQPTDNPNFVAGVSALGIKWLGSDTSRGEEALRTVGGATTTPRYPINIFYNALTVADEISEYNWIYTSVADGGSGYCTEHPDTTTCIEPLDPVTGFTDTIVPLQTSLRMADVLHNDPRSIMIHATNLTGDRIIYPVLDSILATYRSLMTPATPIVNPKPSETGTILLRDRTWAEQWSPALGSSSTVDAYLQGGIVHVTGPSGIAVPITVPDGTEIAGGGPAFGEAYGGERSAWVTLGTSELDLAIPAGTPANPTVAPAPTAVAVHEVSPGTVQVTWTPAASDGGRAADFAVRATTDGKPDVVIAVTRGTSDVTFTGLDPTATYHFSVATYSSLGLGTPVPAS